MTVDDKGRLLDLLSGTHTKILAVLKEVDLEMPVYKDGSWRIRDILGHIATWDRQVTLSLRAYSQGKEYAVPDFDEDGFNEEDVKRQQALTSEQIYGEWRTARGMFKDVVRDMPRNLFPGDLLYPWGDERGTIEKLVTEMCDHDEEHYTEITKAVETFPLQ